MPLEVINVHHNASDERCQSESIVKDMAGRSPDLHSMDDSVGRLAEASFWHEVTPAMTIIIAVTMMLRIFSNALINNYFLETFAHDAFCLLVRYPLKDIYKVADNANLLDIHSCIDEQKVLTRAII